MFVGDIMLDCGPGHLITNGLDPFSECAGLLGQADLVVGNLECVLGGGGHQLDKPFTFRGADGSAPLLRKYFHAVSLANNHSGDFGPGGITETMQILKAANLPYFGAGKNIREACSPLILESKGQTLALLGYNEFRATNYAATEDQAGSAPLEPAKVLQDIRQTKAVNPNAIVIPYLHWGEELVSIPRADQTVLAKQMIDAGASAVIGAHPHVVQTVDYCRNCPIAYSLGNFVFDYFPYDPPKWLGWAVQLTYDKKSSLVEFQTFAVELDSSGVPRLVEPN
jgi:poly-gamma-glutamate synthesis protein (capsule biosynthesis protein)